MVYLYSCKSSVTGALSSSQRLRTQWFSKNLCGSEADFLLEEHQREHPEPLQDVPSVHVTQKGAGEVQKKALSSFYVSYAFHLYGFNR